jgi:hypothetical protein
MRSAALVVGAGLFILQGTTSLVMAADPLPVRKPGSWELTTIAPTVGMRTF